MYLSITILLFILGILIIIKGGDFFVDSAIWIAEVTAIPNIIIGATIVSLATTLPELFVSTIASSSGSPDMAIGNAIGSTICNIGLILAISIIFMAGKVNKKSFTTKGFLMIGSTLILAFFSRDLLIVKYEGIVLLLLLVLYIVLNFYEAKNSISSAKEAAVALETKEKQKTPSKTIIINITKFVVGALFIVIGANLLVDNGKILAEYMHVPEQIISLTLIALGTSLPELVTAITALVKKEHSLSVGNILGANILNITMILGACSVISPNGLIINSRDITIFGTVLKNIPQTLYIDIPVTLLLMLIILLPGIIKGRFKKINGILALCVYITYIALLASICI